MELRHEGRKCYKIKMFFGFAHHRKALRLPSSPKDSEAFGFTVVSNRNGFSQI